LVCFTTIIFTTTTIIIIIIIIIIGKPCRNGGFFLENQQKKTLSVSKYDSSGDGIVTVFMVVAQSMLELIIHTI